MNLSIPPATELEIDASTIDSLRKVTIGDVTYMLFEANQNHAVEMSLGFPSCAIILAIYQNRAYKIEHENVVLWAGSKIWCKYYLGIRLPI